MSILARWNVGPRTLACWENRVIEVVDELEVVEGFAVGRSVNVWAVEGRGWLVINVDELGKYWESGIAEKEGWRGRWIARWVINVEWIAHSC